VVLPLWVVENRSSPLLWPLAYTTACTTVQAVIPAVELKVRIRQTTEAQQSIVTLDNIHHLRGAYTS